MIQGCYCAQARCVLDPALTPASTFLCMMSRIGIVSIALRQTMADHSSMKSLYAAVGYNAGNLLFTNAVFRQLEGEKTRISYRFNTEQANESFDAVVIPAANWINPQMDLGHLATAIEGLKIPVIVIGIGAQGVDYGADITLTDGTQRFLKAVFDRSASVSVRGEFTQKVLETMGYRNTRVTGCPSLYCDFRDFDAPAREKFKLQRCLIHATRFYTGDGVFANGDGPNQRLFRFAFRRGLDYLYQSEFEEMALLFGLETLETMARRPLEILKKIYRVEKQEKLAQYIRTHGRSYLDVDRWADDVARYCFVYGTRLHGTIMALNSGVPATLLWHDTRTREIAEFAAIPSLDAKRADISAKGLRRAYEAADLDRYYRRRAENSAAYVAFLKENKIAPALKNIRPAPAAAALSA